MANFSDWAKGRKNIDYFVAYLFDPNITMLTNKALEFSQHDMAQ